MSSPDPIQQYIDAATDLRKMTREAHEAIKDLKAVIKVVNQIRAELPDTAVSTIENAVSAGIEEFSDSLRDAIEEAEKSVFKRFARIERILMGDEERAKGGPDLEEQVRDMMSKLGPGEREVMYSWARLVLTSV